MSLINLEELRNEIRKIIREEIRVTCETPESIRLEAEMTPHALARSARVSASTIRRIERGRIKMLQIPTIKRLAAGLGVPYERYAHACTAVQRRTR